MSTRRKFLQLLGLAAPAAALAPTAMLESGKATDIPKLPVHTSGYLQVADAQMNAQNAMVPPMRYLGIAQLKMEGEPTSFDPGDPHFEDEISRFAREAFGPKPGRWPTPPEDET